MVVGLPLSSKLSPGKWLTDSPEKVRGSLYQLLLSPGFATSRRERGCTALPPPGWVRACPADEVNGTLGSREPREVEGERLFRTSQAAASDSMMTSGGGRCLQAGLGSSGLWLSLPDAIGSFFTSPKRVMVIRLLTN